MANEEHLKILKQGVKAWNKWRKDNPDIEPDLRSANITGWNLCDANFSCTDLSYSILENTDFSGASLHCANLSYSELKRAKFLNSDLNSTNLIFADLEGSSLINANLRYSNLNRAGFKNSILARADLEKANLSNTNFHRAILFNANLSCANLKSASLRYTSLSQANLYGADLSNAVLTNSDLCRVDLREANLREAHFLNACLTEADLSRADITGVNLYGTSRDHWRIGGIICEYIYWDLMTENRMPEDRNFSQGEFEKLYEQLPTIKYYFENGFTPIDAILMDRVVEAIKNKNPEFELRLDSLHSRGRPHATFTVLYKEVADEALNQIKSEYEARIAKLEGERNTLEKCFIRALEEPRTIIRRIEMGDKYKIKGQTGAVGPGAAAHDMTFNQIWNQVSPEIDMRQLSDELSQLRQGMKKESETLEHDTAIGEIAAAEIATQANDGPKALEHLKKAGKWAFNVAENIGTTIAAEALKKAMGL